MPVRASLRPLLGAAAALEARERGRPEVRSVAQRRADAAKDPLQMRNVSQRVHQQLETVDHRVPVAGGDITVRSYRPVLPPRWSGFRIPVHVFFHGGSFWLGSVAEYEPLCRWYAANVVCLVVSVEYRLAPEFPFPTGVEDCYAALCWVAEHADDLGVDLSRLSVGGVSAGGTMAAAVSVLARDRGGPDIVLQVLEIPATDLTLSHPSIDEFAEGHFLTKASLQEAYRFYLPDASPATIAAASPLLADSLAGLPPAFVLTCECDPLRDEGEAYAARLGADGGMVSGFRVPGHVHGSIYLTRFFPSARAAVARTCAALTAAYSVRGGQ